ncbi:MAG: hypothetical protein KKE23_02830 [Nanoarchaeota archaeon]|nr:hypothetical protein [Nanoarchaeota archaeon]
MNRISKKGLVGESLTLFVVTMVVIALLLVFFFMIKGFGKSGSNVEEMESFSLEDSAKFSLGAYINTPVNMEYGGENITIKMSELMRLAKINGDYKKILESNTRAIFKEIYGGDYHVSISFNNSNMLSVGRSLALPQKTEKISPEKFILKTISIPDIEIDLYIFEK